MLTSLESLDGSIRTRCSESPARVVVDQSVSGALAFVKRLLQAVDGPNPSMR
jgi:hypothetical protein